MSDRYVFGDFEFNNREVILGCFLDTEGSETTLDFRDGKNRDAIQNFICGTRRPRLGRLRRQG
jgi:hypothetical protein